MVATLSAPISSTFGSLSRLPWLLLAFFIANPAIQPLSGKLPDIYGRRTGLIVSNIIFALGNLLCAIAQSEWQLICGRLLAGTGGGGIAAVSTFVLSDLVPLRRRGLWQGIGNTFFGTGTGLGGIFGGWLNDAWGWRVAFWIQVLFTFLAVAIIFWTVDIPITDNNSSANSSKLRKVDFLGASTLFTALTLTFIALSSGGNIIPWTHPLILIGLPLSVASLLLFIYIELNIAVEPIIPVQLLWNQSVAAACFTNFFSSMSRFALLFYLPLYLQVQGYSPRGMGLRLVPGSVAVVLASLGSGLFVRWSGRYYKIGVLSQITYIVIVGVESVATFTPQTPSWIPFVSFFMANIGYGSMLVVTILAILATVGQKEQAVMASALFAFRSTGTILGITLEGLTFQNSLRAELWKKIGTIDNAEERISRLIQDLRVIDEFSGATKSQILQAYMNALHIVFLLLLGISIKSLASIFYQKPPPAKQNVTQIFKIT
ncbi:hypothetical protein NHQ30_003553 [Ciborinia camelliae]|nr:hypothetical protein NHQ30_003553 [Ciborinia camelliae]